MIWSYSFSITLHACGDQKELYVCSGGGSGEWKFQEAVRRPMQHSRQKVMGWLRSE